MDRYYGEREGLQRLRAADPVWFAEDACLIVRRPGMSCSLCKEACPAGVLSGNQWSIALETEGCIGCGLCAATCPTGAISVDGFALAEHVSPANSERVILECRRVPVAHRDADAIVVPCLGGLTVPDILDLSASGVASITLQDHGWCEDCPVGGCSQPWDANLASARSTLDQIDSQRSASLMVQLIPIPVDEAEPISKSDSSDTRSNRRHFFRQLAGLVPAHDAMESKRIVFGRGAVRPVQRERILATARELAKEMDRPVPLGLMPAIEIGEACDLHGICAAICPTEALRKVTVGDGGMTIEFNAEKCIACGECQRACPRKALSLKEDGDQTFHEYPITLVSRHTRTCNGCGETFVPARNSNDGLCIQCNRSVDLMRNMSNILSGRQLTS